MKETDEEREEGIEGGGEKRARAGDHHKSITMAMIAKAAGVSQGAISSLLNDRDYGIRVSEKTRERVFRACREMGYIPNDLRAVVRMYPEQGELCLLVSSDLDGMLDDPFVSRVAGAALDAGGDFGRQLAVAQFDPALDYHAQPESQPGPVRNGTASRFIMMGTPNLSLIQAIAKRNFPVAFLSRKVAQPGVTSILPDYADASRQALDCLFKLGHRHIAILAGPFGTSDPRIIELNVGVRLGYEAIGVPIEAQNILYGDLGFENGVSSIDLLLERTPAPTAVFCFSDTLAAGVLHRAQSRGVKVPEELSVVGCSDDPCSRILFPPLTTVHIPAEEMTRKAVEALGRRVRDDAQTVIENVILPVRMTERASCVPPKQ